jgi:hypothetical protein
MRERIRRFARIGSRVLMLAVPVLLVASLGFSAALERLSAEFQSQSEIATTATPIGVGTPGFPGGAVVYDKTLNIPPGVAYISFSAQADTHDGAALLMSASVTDANGTTVCQPMATAGGAALFGAPWMTLLKLPTDADWNSDNNCNDGGGGSADCHDNNIFFSCCVLVSPTVSGSTSRDVQIRLASSNGGTVFYEDSTIYIDRGPNAGGGFCKQVDTSPH